MGVFGSRDRSEEGEPVLLDRRHHRGPGVHQALHPLPHLPFIELPLLAVHQALLTG